MNKNIYIVLDRVCAWFLFVGIILYFISGFAMAKGIINPGFFVKVHLDYLTIVVAVVFVYHTGYATRLALMRWRKWNQPYKSIWVGFFIVFIVGFFYVDKIYTPSGNAPAATTSQSDDNQSSVSGSTTAAASNSSSVFTASELAKYDGQNGNPAYVAIDGNVYNLSSVFVSGSHFSHFAGTELTNAFYSRHVKNVLSKYPIVGTLSK
jgi:predicted heme/steroid binding protein